MGHGRNALLNRNTLFERIGQPQIAQRFPERIVEHNRLVISGVTEHSGVLHQFSIVGHYALPHGSMKVDITNSYKG